MIPIPVRLNDDEKRARSERDRTRDDRRQNLWQAMTDLDVDGVRQMTAHVHPEDGLVTVNLLCDAAQSSEPTFLELLVAGCTKTKTLGEAFKQSVRKGDRTAVAAFARVCKVSFCQHVLREAAMMADPIVFETVFNACDPTQSQASAFRAGARMGQWHHVRHLLPRADPNVKTNKVMGDMLGPVAAPEDLLWATLERLTDQDAFKSTARRAAIVGRLDLLRWALDRCEDKVAAFTGSLMGAAMNHQGAAVDLLLTQANVEAIHTRLAEQAGPDPAIWEHLDFLGTRVAMATQAQWLTAHPTELPHTQRMHQAAIRAQRAGDVHLNGTRARNRP